MGAEGSVSPNIFALAELPQERTSVAGASSVRWSAEWTTTPPDLGGFVLTNPSSREKGFQEISGRNVPFWNNR
jgi:hypothetical protein